MDPTHEPHHHHYTRGGRGWTYQYSFRTNSGTPGLIPKVKVDTNPGCPVAAVGAPVATAAAAVLMVDVDRVAAGGMEGPVAFGGSATSVSS